MSQSSATKAQPEFTGWRAIFWPIHNFELKKFLPMGFMMFCILFNYTVLRDTKDSLVVTAPGSDAGVLAFIKLWGTLPSTFIFMVVYAKLANVLSKENLFYASILPFLIFFTVFSLVIYPNIDFFHMSLDTLTSYHDQYPHAKRFFTMIGNWSFSVFYIMSELWGSVVISVLFWQFANEITRVQEAKRFYALFGMLGNVGLIFSGTAVWYFSEITRGMPKFEAQALSIKYLMSAVALLGFTCVSIYWWMNRNVLTDKRLYNPDESAGAKKGKSKKPKLSLAESFKHILSSPYLGLIAMLVLSYGVSINVVEGVWKGQIKIRFPNLNDYNAFMGRFSMTTGVITIILMLVGSNILRRFSWRTAAMITPVMIMITSLMFFGAILYSNQYSPFDAFMGTTIVMMTILVGMAQNVLSKSTKYSLFDSTKEMAYIPLDQELKVKGKAAVDMIGGRAGKSGGALIQVIVLTVFAGQNLADLAGVLAFVVIGIVALWLVSVFALGKRFKQLTGDPTPGETDSKSKAA